MSLFYNSAQPVNIKSIYNPYDNVDFLVKMPANRSMKQGSLRMSGYLKVSKILSNGNTAPIEETDSVFTNQWSGVHSVFKNVAVSINDRIVENLQNYPRWAAMKAQSEATPETLLTSSKHMPELKGCLNNYLLIPTANTKGTPFSMHPHICVNNSSDDLPQSKFQQIKLNWILSSGLESFYISTGEPNPLPNPSIVGLTYQLTDLEMHWYETNETPIQKTVLKTVFNTTQTITGLNNNMQVSSPTAYDNVSISFLRQSKLNNLYYDSVLSEYISDISRLEFTVNGVDSPLSYAILPPAYQEIALNYWKSLDSSEKNSLMNRFLSENGCFGVGASFTESINDKLQVALTISDGTTYNPSANGNAIDAYIYIAGYLEV